MFIKKFGIFLLAFVAGYVQANDNEIIKCEYYKYVVDFKREDYNKTSQYLIDKKIEYYKEKGYELVGYSLDQTNNTGKLRVIKYDVKKVCDQKEKSWVEKSSETVKGAVKGLFK